MSVVGNDGFTKLPVDSDVNQNDVFDYPEKEISEERLLVYNERFLADVKNVRERFDINVGTQGDYSDAGYLDFYSNPPEIINDARFIQAITEVARKIKLPGDWAQIIIDYVFGIDNIGNYGVFSYPEKHALGRVVDEDGKRYVELRLYGDITVQDMRTLASSKSFRELVKQTTPIKKPYKRDDTLGYRVDRLRIQGLTYHQIWEQLKLEKHTYADYSSIRRLHTRFLKRVDNLYA